MTELLHTSSILGKYEIEWSRTSLEEFWGVALTFVIENYYEQFKYYCDLSVDDITPGRFWSEYCWCVYTSGFNAAVVSKKFTALMNAYGPWDYKQPAPRVRLKVLQIFANKKKCDSILKTRKIMQELGWEEFQEVYFSHPPESFAKLPFIGSVTCYHIARNLGFDCVKEDIHIVRLANWFGFPSGTVMCEFLSGLSGERVGVVDYILWCYATTFKTTELTSASV